jgi:aminoglycoside phosphotransferase (APT) family kinase protein
VYTGQVAATVREQFPDVCPGRVSYLGEGCDSWAFDVDDRWVFRFPKRADVEQQLLLEARVLPVLAARSTLALPDFCFLGRPSAGFARHFGGYPKIPGVPAIRVDAGRAPLGEWARTLARFLSWLHAVPVDEAKRLGLTHEPIAPLIEEVRADALAEFECLNQVAPEAPLEAWLACLTDGPPRPAARSSSPVVAHRDLAAEHVLCDPESLRLTGIIDWSEIAISDGLVDVAGLFHWGGEPLVDAVLASYDGPLDRSGLRDARFLAACRGVADVAFGLDTSRREYVDAGIRALTLCLSPNSSHRIS